MKYTPSQYAEALYLAMEGKDRAEFSAMTGRFLDALRKNHDSSKISFILRAFEQLDLKKRGLKKIDVESAAPLEGSVRKELIRRVGGRVILNERINVELIAGMRIIVDDELVIDASGARQLQRMFNNAK